jgi:hypothetical protein
MAMLQSHFTELLCRGIALDDRLDHRPTNLVRLLEP